MSCAMVLYAMLFAGDDPVSAAEGVADRSHPNVILILADDLAIGDLTDGNGDDGDQRGSDLFGSDLSGSERARCRTPHLDKLAERSIRFSQAYSASCVCAPARAALLTGRYPHRTGVVTLNMNNYPTMTRLHLDEVTIANMMHDSGYVTGLIGKWHTGRGQGYHPLQRGFDEFEGFDGSDVVGYYRYRLDVQGTYRQVSDRYLTDDLTQRAIEFVRRHRDRPFFLHLAYYAPHRPLEAPADVIRHYLDQGFDESTATIYAMIEVMDRGIGALLGELDQLDLSSHTIVLFASDNGPDPLTGERFNRQLRGTKYQIYEGGIRVPLYVCWPGQLQPSERKQMVHFVDLLPTIIDLCGIEPPTTHALDGNSFATVLRDSDAEFSPTRYWQWNRGHPNYTHNAAMREGAFKLVRPYVTRNSRLEDSLMPAALYDLASDPFESRDVTHEHPDIASRMLEQLQQWSSRVEEDRVRPIALEERP